MKWQADDTFFFQFSKMNFQISVHCKPRYESHVTLENRKIKYFAINIATFIAGVILGCTPNKQSVFTTYEYLRSQRPAFILAMNQQVRAGPYATPDWSNHKPAQGYVSVTLCCNVLRATSAFHPTFYHLLYSKEPTSSQSNFPTLRSYDG